MKEVTWEERQDIRKTYRLGTHLDDMYSMDWAGMFTPIESDCWSSIRGHGLPFHPQYPVGNKFVDFADPEKKIAIEADGKQFHEKKRDAVRDAELAELGWIVFRLTGSECRKTLPSWADMMEMTGDASKSDVAMFKHITETSEGFFFALAWLVYQTQLSGARFETACRNTLIRHCTTNNAPLIGVDL